MFGAVAMFGSATIVFGLSTVFWLSLGALVLLGASDVISVVIRNSLVQLESEQGKPRNPFINAGAIVMADSLVGLGRSDACDAVSDLADETQ